MAGTLVSFFEQRIDDDEKGIMFINQSDDHEFISYRQLYNLSLTFLYDLQALGVDHNVELVLLVDDNKQFLIAFWACQLGGIKVIPLAAATRDEYRSKMIKIWKSLEAPFLVSDSLNLERIRDYCIKNSFDDELAVIEQSELLIDVYESAGRPGVAASVNAQQISYIQYSSGSTGEPKGVVLTHANLVSNVLDIAERSAIGSSDAMLSWMPLTHDMGLICFHLTGMLTGINQFIMPTSLFIRRPVLWIELAGRYKVSLLYSPNFGYEYFLLAYKEQLSYNWDLSSVRLIYNGAESISEALCREFLHALKKYNLNPLCMFPGYGLAEASVAVSLPVPGAGMMSFTVSRNSVNIGDRIQITTPEEGGITYVAVGRPIATCNVRICDNDDRVLPENHLGNIQIKGPNVTGGYYKNAQVTKKIKTGDGWLRTGDLGFFRNNQLVIAGRAKNLIIINGQNYYPADIESVALKIPGIGRGKVVACSIREKDTAEKLVIFVLFKDAPEKFAGIVRLLQQVILAELGLVVHAIVPVNKIPKTTSGKIQHFRLVEQYQSGEYNSRLRQLSVLLDGNDRGDAGKGIPTIEGLIHLIEHITGIKEIKEQDNFFELGINSLQAMQILNRLTGSYNLNLSIKEFFDKPTVAGLYEALGNQNENSVVLIQPQQGSNRYDLSPVQMRFWALEKSEKDAAPLNISLVYNIEGALNSQALELAIRELVGRHESLRTVIVETDDGLKQKVADRNDAAVCLEQFSFSDANNYGFSVEAFLQSGCNRKFNISNGPLYRFWLIKTADQSFKLLIVFHHMICDGWSLSLIIRELSESYNAFLHNRPVQLPPMAMQAASCIVFREQNIPAAQLEKSRHYWLKRMEDLPPLIKFPFIPRVATSHSAGARKIYAVPQAGYKAIRSCGAALQATVFMMVTAFSYVLIRRLTNQLDVVIGTDDAGRIRKESENQVGCFIRTIPLRIVAGAGDTFVDVVGRVKQAYLDAAEFSGYSFEALLNERQTRRETVGTDLFNVLVLLQKFDTNLQLDDLRITNLPIRNTSNLVDVQLEFIEANGELFLDILYNEKVISAEGVDRMWDVLMEIISNLTNNSSLAVDAFDIITPAEKSGLLGIGSGTAVQYPVHQTFLNLFYDQVRKAGGDTALYFENRETTYSALNQKANKLAAYLVQVCDVQKGDRVAVLAERSDWVIIAIIAIFKSGASWVPVDTAAPQQRIDYILQNCNAQIVCLETPEPATVVKGIRTLVLPEIISEKSDLLFNEYDGCIAPEDEAYVMFTSGTQGQPKGVMIDHYALHDYIMTFGNYFKLCSGDSIIHQASTGFDTAVEEIFPVLAFGGKLAIHKHGGKDIDGMVALIKQLQVRIISSTPLVLRELNKHAGLLQSLRLVISGGEELKGGDIDQLLHIAEVYNTYGPTESTVCSSYFRVDMTEERISIGKPIVNRKIYILNEHLLLQPAGVAGEICIAGAGLAKGYLGDREMTLKKFVPDPYEKGSLLYRTGDLGRVLFDGNIEFLGRNDGQVKINGYRVELKEVEVALGKHTGIKNVLVVAKQVAGGKKLVAYVESTSIAETSTLRLFAKTVLPHYMIPAVFHCIDKFPLTVNGKIDLAALPEDLVFEEIIETENPLLSELTNQFKQIWSNIFNTTNISIHDGFFNIGGNSIKAFQLASAVKNKLGFELDIKLLLAGLSIKEIVQLCDLHSGKRSLDIKKIPPAPYYIASQAQNRLWILNQLDSKANSSNLNWSYVLEGHIDVVAFCRALEIVTGRHETFFTSFTMLEHGLVQQVHEPGNNLVAYEDVRTKEKALEYARLLVQEDARTPISLEDGKLIKLRLFRVDDLRFILSVTIHHIAIDAWSADIVAGEIYNVYTDFISGKNNPLHPLHIQYKDYCAWEFDMLHSAAIDEAKNWWLHKLHGQLPFIAIAPDFEKKTVRNYNNSDFLLLAFNKELSDALFTFCKVYKLSMPVVLTAALHCFLHKEQHRNTIITGLMLNGRSHPELQEQVGFFVNTLPVYMTIDENTSCIDFISAVKQSELEILQYQYYPYNLLCEDVERGEGLFDIIVSSENEAVNKLYELPGVKVKEFLPRSNWRTDFALSLILENKAGGAVLQLLFDADLYKRTTVERTGRSIMTIISKMIENSAMLIKDLSVEIEDVIPDLFKNYESSLSFPPQPIQTNGDVQLAGSVIINGSNQQYAAIRQYTNEKNISFTALLAGITGVLFAKYNFRSEIIVGVDLSHIKVNEGAPVFVKALRPGEIIVPLRIDISAVDDMAAYLKRIDGELQYNARLFATHSINAAGNLFDIIISIEEAGADPFNTFSFTSEKLLQLIFDNHNPRLFIKGAAQPHEYTLEYFSRAAGSIRPAMLLFSNSLMDMITSLVTECNGVNTVTGFSVTELERMFDNIFADTRK